MVQERKEFLTWNKMHFSSFLKGLYCQKFPQTQEWAFKHYFHSTFLGITWKKLLSSRVSMARMILSGTFCKNFKYIIVVFSIFVCVFDKSFSLYTTSEIEFMYVLNKLFSIAGFFFLKKAFCKFCSNCSNS